MNKNGGGMNGEFEIHGLSEEAAQAEAASMGARKMFRIVIDDGDEYELPYTVVSVNGKVYQIKRGVEVPVPEEVINVLRDAVAHKVVQKQLPDGRRMTTLAKYNRIPWHYLGPMESE